MVFTGRTHAIKRVQFGILGPDEIRNMSVTQKTNARERAVDAGISKYETYLDGKGVYGGVNDPRMGSLDDKEDPGHFGHIELARPCYHLGYLKETLMVLRCVCFHCSRLMADPSDYRVQAAQKLKCQRRFSHARAVPDAEAAASSRRRRSVPSSKAATRSKRPTAAARFSHQRVHRGRVLRGRRARARYIAKWPSRATVESSASYGASVFVRRTTAARAASRRRAMASTRESIEVEFTRRRRAAGASTTST